MLKKQWFVFFLVGMMAGGITACGGSQAPAPAPTAAPVSQAPADPPTPTPPPATATAAVTPAPAVEMPLDEPTTLPETPTAVPGVVRTFVIVPEQSKASYIVDEEFFGGALGQLGIQPGQVKTIGSTQAVNGQLQLDFGNLSSPLIGGQFEVNLNTLTSDQSRRDNRIRQANLESDKYPLARFTLESLQNTPSAYNNGETVTFLASGQLTIREITQPAVFEVTAALQDNTITGTASTRLKMTDFGFDPPNFANLFAVGDEFTAQVEFTFQESS